jgi:hypothetical protein
MRLGIRGSTSVDWQWLEKFKGLVKKKFMVCRRWGLRPVKQHIAEHQFQGWVGLNEIFVGKTRKVFEEKHVKKGRKFRNFFHDFLKRFNNHIKGNFV